MLRDHDPFADGTDYRLADVSPTVDRTRSGIMAGWRQIGDARDKGSG